MIDETIVKKFLNTLNSKYYVFGGMALSKMFKSIKSSNWDIVIDKRVWTKDQVIKKLKKFYQNIDCNTEKNFTKNK